ncbi:MAG: hypothetical protein V4805_12160 [Pseudomonadota bacterium]
MALDKTPYQEQDRQRKNAGLRNLSLLARLKKVEKQNGMHFMTQAARKSERQ